MTWKLEQTYIGLPEMFYTRMKLENEWDAEIVLQNEALAEELGLDPNKLGNCVDVFAGNASPEGATPLAQAYAGHQFGNFTRLGDGRAVLLGEQVTPAGERFDIGLKGAGQTAYSRGGDGLAAIGPMLREYIISEAMHGLGIPTTRSLAVVTTSEPVYREETLQGAVLTRVAASHLRVGTFQYAAALGTRKDVTALADYAIARHDVDLVNEENKYVRFLQRVMERQAKLIADWMAVGFVHGVMNTDNVTISGETIDYGPCAFLDVYQRDTVFSSIDRSGRYAYGKQPYMGAWNLTRFAESLLPLLAAREDEAVALAEETLAQYEGVFQRHFTEKMRAKLGLFHAEASDTALINDLFDLLEKYKADYTNTFVGLTFGRLGKMGWHDQKDFLAWLERWEKRRKGQDESIEESEALMKRHNPAIIPRNHRVEEALQAAEQGDYSVVKQLLAVLKNPYAHSAKQEEYAVEPVSAIPYKTFCGT